jgi:signal peptidase I
MLVLGGLLLLLGLVVVVTVLPFGIASRMFQATVDCMAPAVMQGDYVYVRMRSYQSNALPARGTLVILETGDAPTIQTYDGKSAIYLKRVVGLPGETLAIVDGKVMVNGKAPPELEGLSHANLSVPGGNLADESATFTVPPDCVYLLGDNAGNSYDSRFWGAVPLKALRGSAEACVWPVDRMRGY